MGFMYKCELVFMSKFNLPRWTSFSELLIDHDKYRHHMRYACGFWIIIRPEVGFQVLTEGCLVFGTSKEEIITKLAKKLIRSPYLNSNIMIFFGLKRDPFISFSYICRTRSGLNGGRFSFGGNLPGAQCSLAI